MFGVSLEDKELPLFAGLCFFLSLIDVMIPKPVVFFRLGLANLALMLAMDVLSTRSFFLLLLVKVLGQAMLSGTIFSYVIVFSFIGTFSSGTVIYLFNFLRKKRWISFVGISMLGALVSNISQWLFAYLVLFGEGAWYILPPMMVVSLITSLFIGLFANAFYLSSIWYEGLLTGEIKLANYEKNLCEVKKERSNLHRFIVGGLLIILLMFIDLPELKIIIFATSLVLCVIEKIKINVFHLVFTFICIVLINLFPPYGYVIFEYRFLDIIPIIITKEALLQGIVKAVLFEGLLCTSKWMLRYELNIDGKMGNVIKKALYVFQRLMMCKNEIKMKNLVGSLDSVLLSLDKIL